MKIYKILFVSVIVLFFSIGLMGQGPPNPPGDHGSSTDESAGGGAPIGGGTLVLLGLGALYAGKKVYEMTKPEELEE